MGDSTYTNIQNSSTLIDTKTPVNPGIVTLGNTLFLKILNLWSKYTILNQN